MIFYFTSNKKMWFSRAIAWALKTNITHFAWGTRDNPYALVVESTMATGVRPTWQKTFVKKNRVERIIYREDSKELLNKTYQKVVDVTGGLPYDWKAIAFWSGLSLIQKVAKVTAKANLWQDNNAFYCSETLKAMREYFQDIGIEDLKFLEGDFIAPNDVCEWLLATGKFKELEQSLIPGRLV